MTTNLVDSTQQSTGLPSTGLPSTGLLLYYAQKVKENAEINSQSPVPGKPLPEEGSGPNIKIVSRPNPPNPPGGGNLLPERLGLSANNKKLLTPPPELKQLAQNLLGGIETPDSMVGLVIASALGLRQKELLPEDENIPTRLYGVV
jgi:hypothetical protein